MPLWILSIDMCKAFDTINHHALMQALRSRNLPDEYVALLLLLLLYTNQKASVNHSSEFPIQRSVKQGYILRAMLFNCVLSTAFDECRLSLHQACLFTRMVFHKKQIRDDMLLYAKSLDE